MTGVEAWVVAAAGGADATLVAAGTGMTDTELVTTGDADVVVVVSVLPVFAEFALTTELVSAATASGVQALAPEDQPTSRFATSEA